MFPDGRVDLDGAQRLATHLVAHGHDGLIVSGTTGESPTTSDAEKDQLLRAVLEAVGDRATIVAGVGSNNTAHSVDNAAGRRQGRRPRRAGRDAVLQQATAGGAARATSPRSPTRRELPVMVYDIPGRSGIAIHTETLLRLAEHPRIRAVKDAKGDLFASSQVMARSDLQYYSGDDVLNLAHLTQGAVGIASVVGHVAGPQYAEMVAAVAGGDLPRAIALHRQLIPAVNAVMNITQGAIMAKAALRELGVIASAAVRLPAGRGHRRPGRAGARRSPTVRTDLSHPHPELTTPPPLPQDGVRVVALGGLGEVGRNMTVIEHAGRLLVVDCGVLFPEDHQPGVDLILPDFEYIADRLDDIDAIVLTHGHEDHIGAVPYLLRLKADIPLIGSQLTLALVEAKLQGAPDQALHPHRRRRGSASGWASSTASSSRSTTRSPTRSPWPSAPRPARCCTPATSRWTSCRWTAGSPTCAPSPGSARRASTCSSPTPPTPRSRGSPPPSATSPRPSTGSSARPSGGSSSPASPPTCTACSRSSTPPPPTTARSPWSAARCCATWASPRSSATCTCRRACSSTSRSSTTYPDDQVVLICTGSQGEPMAALSRMANRDHQIEVGQGDTVVLASSLIPGNENAVFRVINGLMHLGADVVHKGNAKVHVSGHASAGELLYCYNIVKPRNVMPVHGEWRHLIANGDLAVATGVPRDQRGARRGRRRGRPRRRPGHDHRCGALRLRLRRRLLRRRHHRGAAEGPPDPAATRASSPSSSCVDRPPARSSPARRSRPAASPRSRRSSTRSGPGSRRRSPTPPHGGSPTPTSCSRSSAAPSARWVGGKLRRRPMIIPMVIDA